MSKILKISTFTQDVITIMVISTVIIIGALHFQATHKDVKAGYIEGTDGYSGYMFAKYNQLKLKGQCEYAKDPAFSEFKTSEEFMQGCHKYFEE
ncbi:hypothetical protein F975_01631 [Acinetobacter sp. ANC 3789]|uniref:hypothetical protein n=1 Tax=Acinetobacter sp. ANC 3789 TaxID=1217714 RepID=UPI0002D062AE|nr:hypothetical protein [Acinetobacter sp. ANC 3789]ENU80577.1 hypothetical protein F975_01631 [Acinetobacter sp. ANC 3789]